MTELRKVREERQHYIRGGSLGELGKAVDGFVATPLEDGWELGGIRLDAGISHIRSGYGIERTSIGYEATIETVRTEPYGRPA